MGPKKGKKRGSEEEEAPAAAAAAAAAAKPSKKKAKAAAEEQPPKAEEESEDVLEGMSDDEGEEEEDSEEDGEPSAVEVWQQQLKERAQAMNAIVCMVGGLDKDGDEEDENEEEEEDEDEEEEEITVEKLEKCVRLFLPKKTEEFLEPLAEALAEIGCTPPDSEDMEGDEEAAANKAAMANIPEELKALFAMSMRSLTTRHSLPMQELLKASLKEVDKSLKAKKYEDAFCRWTATLMAANDEEHWYGDTEDAEAAEGIFKQMKKQWGQLKKLSLKDLGSPSAEGPLTDPKQALEHMLDTLGNGMKGMDYEV